ncbi:MAG: hypothetical protein HY060_04635 [Proteobacteria bacterium]|nr:hypothetical protein [Pseudomonadota bacterium]
MKRQNRVTPFGTIVRPPAGSAARGDFLGNRGCLHDDHGELRGRPWRTRAWITCRLAFKGRRRALMTPRRWTELFFLDEATAFAAGHRPCGECRWHDYQRFRACWPALAGRPVDQLDAVLHRERVDATGRQVVRTMRSDDLPDGTFVALAAAPDRALLKWGERLFAWSLDGYAPAGLLPPDVLVLTPPALIAVLRRGYRLAIHASGPLDGAPGE